MTEFGTNSEVIAFDSNFTILGGQMVKLFSMLLIVLIGIRANASVNGGLIAPGDKGSLVALTSATI